jgi:hypothetical protein
MCLAKCGLAALAVIFLSLGCSSSSLKSGLDGSANDQEAGRALDTTAIDSADGKASKDVHDTSAVDGTALDVNIALDAHDGALDRLATKDGAADRGEVLDAPQVVDTEIAGIDAPSDIGLAGLGTCASPIDIPAGRSKIDVQVSTAQAVHVLNFPCGSNGADIVIRIHVLTQQPQLFYADTFGAAWNTMLFFSDTCEQPKAPTGADIVACSDDACGTSQSQVVAVLNYGYHYLLVSGANGESGDVTVHVQSAILGSGTIANLLAGTGSVEGNTSGIDRSGLCDTSGAKNNYWWQSCPDDVPGAFTASTCGGARWDTALSLQIPRADILSCNDDDNDCGMQSTIKLSMPAGAGIQVLTVGGSTGTSIGNYTLTYTRP